MLFYNEVSYEFELKNVSQLYIHAPDTVKTGLEVLLHPYYTNIDSVEIKKYFWDFGDGKYSREENPNHAYEKPGNYEITLGVLGRKNNKPYKNCVTKKVKVRNDLDSTFYSFSPPRKRISKEEIKQKLLDSIAKNDKPFHDFIIKMEKLDSIAFAQNIPLSTNNVAINPKNDTTVRYKVHIGVSEENIEYSDPVFKGFDSISSLKKADLYHYFVGDSKTLIDIIPMYEKAQKAGFKSSIVSLFLNDSLTNNNNIKYRYLIYKDTLKSSPINTESLVINSQTLTPTTTTIEPEITSTLIAKEPVLKTNTITPRDTTKVKSPVIVKSPKNPIVKKDPIKTISTQTKSVSNSKIIPDFVPSSGEITYRVQIGAYQKRKPLNSFGIVSQVIEEKTEDGFYKYMSQDVKNLQNANDLKEALLQMGYTHAFITPYQNGKRLTIIESVEREISIFFDLNSAIVVKDELEKLNYYFRNFSSKKVNQITLEGHCCYLGPTDYNYHLSKRRVFAVEKEIRVFTQVNIIPKFFGESQPKYDNSTERTRRLNRRVDIKINR